MPKAAAEDEIVELPPPSKVRIGTHLVHPHRAQVPEKSVEGYADLLRSIRAGSWIPKILLDGAGRIVDGRARLRAYLEAGVDVDSNPTRYFETVADTDVSTMVLNSMKGESYTKAQVTFVVASLMEPLAKKAWRRQHEGKAVGENFPKGKAADLAAESVHGTNGKWVGLARIMLAKRSPLVGLVMNRSLPQMTQVLEIADMKPAKRRRVIERLQGGESADVVLLKPKARDDLWLTPKYICEKIRAAFDGQIMCDPCAPDESASYYVKAKHKYTKAQDGLDKKNVWYDRTFVNPPFSDPEPWIARAIEESRLGKRIYMLLPVRPASTYQSALPHEAVDVLTLHDRIPFGKPSKKDDGVGQNAIMIVGLNYSTKPLVDMGLEGNLQSLDERRAVRFDAKKKMYLEDKVRPEEFPIGNLEFDGPSPAERRDAEQQILAEQAHREKMVEKGRQFSAPAARRSTRKVAKQPKPKTKKKRKSAE